MLAAHLLMQASRFPMVDSYLDRLRDGVDWSWRAVVELVLIGLVIYGVLRFLEGTRGARLMQAMVAILIGLLLLAFVAGLLQLDRLLVLYPYFVGGAFLIALVVFQPELRRGLMRIGETLGRRARIAQSNKLIEPIVQSCANLSKRKIGALVAIERRVALGALMETGVSLDADVSRELLETIFWPGSALHDLGVIVSHGRVAAAGCEFPLAEPDAANRIIGSRHRAGLGMSLESDAIVVLVSEETGAISVALRGVLHRDLTPEQLREILVVGLLGSIEEPADEPEESEPEETSHSPDEVILTERAAGPAAGDGTASEAEEPPQPHAQSNEEPGPRAGLKEAERLARTEAGG